MRERRPAPEQQVEPRSERTGGSVQARDARRLASQMGNVAFTALARSLTHQPGAGQGPTIGPDGTLEFPPEHIGPSGEEPTVGPDGILEFPPDYIGPGDEGSGGETIEFPPDHITPDSAGAGAATGAAGGSAG